MVRKTLRVSIFNLAFLMILISGCVATQGTKKSELCTSRTSFDSKTQKCTSSSSAPGGTLGNIEILEDSGSNLISLTYHDTNNDLASTCRVVENSNSFEVSSTQSENVKIQAQNIYAQAILVDSVITGGGAAASHSYLLTAESQLKAALLETDQTGLYNYLVSFATYIKFVGLESQKVTSNQTIVNNGVSLVAQMDSITNEILSIRERCYCSGGVCQSYLRPGLNISGQYSFSYSVNDNIDGSSLLQNVNVDIIPVNDPPVPLDIHITGVESSTDTGNQFSFTVPNARDAENDQSIFFTYDIVTSPVNGILSNCAFSGVGGSDLSCSYTPTDGNGLGTGIVSSTTIGNIVFESYARNTSKNAITVELLTKISAGAGVDITVQDTALKIYIVGGSTTAAEIINAVNANLEASAFVKLSIDNAANNSVAQNITSFLHGLSGGTSSYDSFTYKVYDGQTYSTYNATVSIGITPSADAPVARESDTTPLSFNEDTITKVTLGYFDAENDLPTICTVGNLQNVKISKSCDCTIEAGKCIVYLRSDDDYSGTASFQYFIDNDNAEFTNTETVNLTIVEVSDSPFARNESLDGPFESSTAQASVVQFIISPAYIGNTSSTLTYNLVAQPTNGALSGCLNISGENDLVCDYLPNDGNISGVGSISSRGMGTGGNLVVSSKYTGAHANNIQVLLKEHVGISKGNEFIEVSGSSITVWINKTATKASTLANIAAAINSHQVASYLVSASVVAGSENTEQTTEETGVLIGGTDGLDSFDYTVSDGTNSSTGTISINLINTNDPPSICSYSSVYEAPECGASDCISDTSPFGNILPSKTGIIYYQKSSALCYRSTGVATKEDWEIVTGTGHEIPSKIVGQNTSITFNRMRIDEGGGEHATDNENDQTLKLTSITSSNTVLIPENSNNIVLKFNTQTIGLATASFPESPNFGTALISEDDYPLKLEIFPQTGLAGTSTITLQFLDSSGATTDVNFTVTVDTTSVIHGGWTNIAASGPIINKFNDIVEAQKACSYHIDQCNSKGTCLGTTSPVGNSTPDKVGAIYYRSDTSECFYSSGTTSSDWVSLDTYCPITSSKEDSACVSLGAACLSSGAPAITAGNIDTNYYDYSTQTCYKALSTSSISWEIYSAPGEASFSWKAFSILGDGVFIGHNIFRRLSSETFDYENPINKTILSKNDLEYMDNVTNSVSPPIPGTVYYYEVRPVVQSGTPALEFAVGTNVAFNVLRILVPKENKSFVHRWMVNKSTCEKMHATDIDGGNHFRCTYTGPGDMVDNTTGIHYFDFEKDLIVDRFEAGCRYNYASEVENCGGSTFDGSCIGINNPNIAGVIPNPAGAAPIYYERGTGQCWKFDTGGNTWVNQTAHMFGYNSSELPPLVNISQEEAKNFCTQDATTTILGSCDYTKVSCNGGTSDCDSTSTGQTDPNGAVTGNDNDIFSDRVNHSCYQNVGGGTSWAKVQSAGIFQARLPNRKHQIAYSDWNNSKFTESEINNLEAGVSINSTSKCNSFNASGLENYYSDSDAPDINSLFTLPGTATSGIRSFMTGSNQSRSCQSRYGVQDVVGNVAEWTTDRLDCAKENGRECHGVSAGAGFNALQLSGITDTFMETSGGNATSAFDIFRIGYNSGPPDYLVGACQNDDGSKCTDYTTSWVLDTSGPNALVRRFVLPIGLPAATSFNTNTTGLETDPVATSLLEIGSGLGISTSQLHGDKVKFNTDIIAAETATEALTFCGSMSTGGGYTSVTGSDAGMYAVEMTPCTDSDGADTGNTADLSDDSKRIDIGFRCVIEIDPSQYVE